MVRALLKRVGVEYKVTHFDLLIVHINKDELGVHVKAYDLSKSKIMRIFANLIR